MEETVTEVKVDKQQSDLVARALQKSSGQPVYSINEINEKLANIPAEVTETPSEAPSATPSAVEAPQES